MPFLRDLAGVYVAALPALHRVELTVAAPFAARLVVDDRMLLGLTVDFEVVSASAVHLFSHPSSAEQSHALFAHFL